MKDYYDILGVNKNATDEDIKKAYRKLAAKWHPDRWVNATDEEKKTAEEKIKEINEANSVLSDPEKRRDYDMFGSAEPGAGGFNPFEDGFNPFEHVVDPFDGFNPFERRKHVERGEDIEAHVDITLLESFTGVKQKEVNVLKKEPCKHCNGTGNEDGKEHKCTHCNGSGHVIVQNQRSKNSFFQYITDCPYCGGTGKETTNPCKECHGSGYISTYEKKKYDIPSGVFDGAVLGFRGQGGLPKTDEGIPGNLHLVVHVSEDNSFKREGNNLVYMLYLNLYEAWCGCSKTVYRIDGKPYKITINERTEDGYEIVKRGEGFDDVQGFGKGDFVIRVKYEIPTKITKEQKKLLEEFYKEQ